MKIGIVIFAYNRSSHLTRTLEALKKNDSVNEIYVFQDGLKNETHRREWEKTKEVIRAINWCEVHYFLSSENKGLKQSILQGMNYVFGENDAAVVLEDDCIVQPNFMLFMRQGLETYRNCAKVYSVSGYAWPLDLDEGDEDAYFCGRISSWGWGTWRERWEKLELNYEILHDIKSIKSISEQLAIWGNDMEEILLGNIKGTTDSWAVFWGLSVIKQGGLCLNPKKSLVENIGFDGSGMHCGRTEINRAQLMDEKKTYFSLPVELEIKDEIAEKFAPLFQGFIKNSNSKNKQDALIYGMGAYYKKYESLLNEQYNIVAYVDRAKKGYYAGVEIEKIENISSIKYDVIILTMANLSETIKILRILHDIYFIPYKKIKLGQQIYEKNHTHIKKITEDGKICLELCGKEFIVGSYDEYANTMEVHQDRIYEYHINNNRKDVIFDVGGSIGDSALYFLMDQNVKKVYVYEPFPDTFIAAQINLKDFQSNERLELNGYGISDRSEQREILYNQNMSCGQSTISSVREKAKGLYSNLISEEDEKKQIIHVRCASEVFEPLLKEHEGCNLILKMDCEGEEYAIIKNLSQSGLLGKFDFAMLEWHYKGKESLLECLDQAGFSYWCTDKSSEMGLIYAYKCSKCRLSILNE